VNLFFAAFIPGLQDLIAEVIKERLSDVKIHKLLDGAVLFETATGYDNLNFFCFNNIFAVISVMEHADNDVKPSSALEKHIKSAVKNNAASEVISNNNKKFHTFRIVASAENIPAAIDEKLRTDAENYISRFSGLKANRSLPDTEFWFLFRSEKDQNNFSVFMKRLTIRPSWEKTLRKGELPPPLAWTLCRLARLVHGDTVLDLFCGYGSIPEAALKHFHINKFIACDNNREAALYTKARFNKRKKDDFVFYEGDFSALPSLVAEKSIDAIVTDPPWGEYMEINDEAFLEKMFEVFSKLLKDGGRAVVLYAKNDDFLKTVPGCFKPENNVPILLSGKKAVIYQYIKVSSSYCFKV
jgi:tRNA (guanine6-N2)-methyltransferase